MSHLASIRALLAILLLPVVTACATPVRPEKMVPESPTAGALGTESQLRHSIAITQVAGGTETDPLWWSEVGDAEFEEALRSALDRYRYLSRDETRAPYGLKVFIIDVRHPQAGLTITVNSVVRYTLIRRKDGQVLLDDIVGGHFTATTYDAFGAERRKLAQEGAIRRNLSTFLQRLAALGRCASRQHCGDDGAAPQQGAFPLHEAWRPDYRTRFRVPTGFQELDRHWGPVHGYTDKHVGDDEYSILVIGNALTSPQRVVDIALLRAARIAEEKERTHFTILKQAAETLPTHELVSAPLGLLSTIVDEVETQESYAVLLIRLLPEGAPTPTGTLEAAAVIKEVRARLDQDDKPR